jgi:triacylglycerol lipase
MPRDTRYLVDPELIPALDPYPSVDLPIESLAEVRAEFARMLAATPIREDLPVQREELQVPGPAGAPSVRVLFYRPADGRGPRPAVLHIHGGGYVLGAPDFADLSNRLMVAELGCVVCSVDYRLAPEHPYPAPVEDCYAALMWLHDHAASLGVDRSRVGIKGESAGGGLAAALALLARDRGGPSISFQHLTYPMIDDRTCIAPDPHPYVGEFVWTPERNRFGWTALLGRTPGHPDIPAYAAAARATDLTGLPPAFISVGALDLFLEENLEYGRRLTRAGVPVELHVYPGAFHGFGLATEARTTLAATRDSREALRRAMFG